MLLTLLLTGALMAGPPPRLPTPVPSGIAAGSPGTPDQKHETATDKAEPQPVVTRHKGVVGGKELAYTATAGRLPIVNEVGETEAQIFFVAYTADNPAPDKQRPLIFAFNGGPGAASVWLHLGAAGPRRVKMLPDGTMPAPPFRLIDNGSSWLDHADLVFIDPVGTGYSRAVKPEMTQKFTAVRRDIETAGTFIRLYLSRYERWKSPLFLLGESYGTFRAAGLSEYLVDHGIALNGIILISSILNLQTVTFAPGNDLPFVLFLPSYTATSWYHKKLSAPLQADLDEALAASEKWAETEYAFALAKGDRLTPQERQRVADQLAALTGLGKEYILERNLRIDSTTFAERILQERQEMVGLLDSRFAAANTETPDRYPFDPTIAAIRPPYTASFNDYVRTELGFTSDLEYFVLGGGIGRWDWEAKNSYADTTENLANSFAKNPHMKLFVASGCFDLATPHFAAEYSLNHLGIPAALRGNITTRRYLAGHMMYLDTGSRAALKRDVAQFISKAVPPP